MALLPLANGDPRRTRSRPFDFTKPTHCTSHGNLQSIDGRSQMESGFPGNFAPVLKIEGNVSRLRAKPAHFLGHLPRRRNNHGGKKCQESAFFATCVPV